MLKRIVCFASLTLLTAAGGSYAQPSGPDGRTSPIAENPLVASRLGLFEAWTEAHVAYEDWPGVSVGIVHDQELIWTRSFGAANRETGEPAGTQTLYAIGSVTKMFTAIALLGLRDQGKLGLDDPVAEHLPWFNQLRNVQPEAGPVTIRHLLTHSSGLPREAASLDWTGHTAPDLRQLIADLPAQALSWSPGSRWKYSNLGVSLAGAIIATVSGQPYEEYVAEHILGPLGMTATTYSPRPGAKVAKGYGRHRTHGPRETLPVFRAGAYAPACGLWSNVEDLARLASWQFRLRASEEREILRASTLRDMQRVHWLDPTWNLGLGLGFLLPRQPRGMLGHGGHISGFCAGFTLLPADRIGIVVLSNGDDVAATGIRDRIYDWVVPAIRDVLGGAQPVALAPELQKYVGKYQDWGSDEQVLALDGHLVMLRPMDAPRLSEIARLVPQGDHTFRIATPRGLVGPEELVTFELDEEGNVVRFRFLGRTTKERVSVW